MSFSLYDATVPTFQQTLGAMQGLLNKVAIFSAEAKRPDEDLLQACLTEDMLPFTYQVQRHGRALRWRPERHPQGRVHARPLTAAIDLARAARRPVASSGEPRLYDGGIYQQPCRSRHAI